MRGLPPTTDPNVLIGFGTSDDAGVYRVSDDLAIVQTVDFFTPIVDDPYDFGRIAATNALSDVYAMGGTPMTALNICAFPIKRFGTEVFARVVAGGAAVAATAGVAIVGGHTIEADEPTYGMSVTGRVHPDRIVSNAGARPGDVLVLTKPVGTGVLATALKRDAIAADRMAGAVQWMTRLNGAASQAMLAAGAHAATDVTGYGLLGHAGEMARASGVRIRIASAAVPVYALAYELAGRGIAPSGSRNNANEHAAFARYAAEVAPELRVLFSDAQTSGGLLIAIAPDRVDGLRAHLRAAGDLDAVIGSVEAGSGIDVE